MKNQRPNITTQKIRKTPDRWSTSIYQISPNSNLCKRSQSITKNLKNKPNLTSSWIASKPGSKYKPIKLSNKNNWFIPKFMTIWRMIGEIRRFSNKNNSKERREIEAKHKKNCSVLKLKNGIFTQRLQSTHEKWIRKRRNSMKNSCRKK